MNCSFYFAGIKFPAYKMVLTQILDIFWVRNLSMNVCKPDRLLRHFRLRRFLLLRRRRTVSDVESLESVKLKTEVVSY